MARGRPCIIARAGVPCASSFDTLETAEHWTVLHVAQTMAREQQENDASRNEATSLVLEVPLASKLGKFGVERQSSCGGWRQLAIAGGARAMEAT